ncbi:MAG: hypothetical protein M0Z99_23970 [Betaproteobacteria bacterium]|nr:hypothetical protein [Betaproteobacteria bacterium]
MFNQSKLVNLAMIAALIVIAVVGHRFSPLLLPKTNATGQVDAGCNLQQRACPATLPGGGRVQLSITPRPIPYLQALTVEVRTSGIEVHKVEVDFAGASMNMGYNRAQLAAAESGRHTGEASLPVCVSGGMTWVATVLIETDRQRIAVPYRFDVGR